MALSWKILKCNSIAKRCFGNLVPKPVNLKKTDTFSSLLPSEDVDLSVVTPQFQKSFNLAAYVNSSETLKKFVDLDVDLSKIEKNPFIAEQLLKLDFEKNVKEHILFLQDYVEEENLSWFITKNPMIFYEPLEDLQVRVNYLKSKQFSNKQIKVIVSKNPHWLMFSTVRIDARLGFIQEYFELTGTEVRNVAVAQPKLITYNLNHIKTNSFVVKEEMGFETNEVKELLLKKPRLWIMNQKSLLQRFNYVHNVIKIPHKTILQYPQILECREFRLKQRHTFLQQLGRAQYDPNKENYVPIMALAEGTDVQFCNKYGKCSVSDYNTYLKTL